MSAAHADAVSYHASLADGWERRCEKLSFKMRESVLQKCLEGRPIDGTVWLDAGCGTGTLARWLATRGCSVLGVDAAPEMVAVAARAARTPDFTDRLSFVHVNTIARLALDDNFLDGILCSSVLEYVDDPGACLNEFARVLKPGGVLVVSVPNRNSVVRRVQCAYHRLGLLLGQKWGQFLDYSHHHYSTYEFERLLWHAGLVDEKLVPFGSPLPGLARRTSHWAPLLMFVAQKAGTNRGTYSRPC